MLLMIEGLAKRQTLTRGEGGKFVLMAYVNRYVRLTPIYGLVLLVFMYLFPLFGNSPSWQGFQQGINSGDENCFSYWWTNMLYVNNMYPDQFGSGTSGSLGCMGW